MKQPLTRLRASILGALDTDFGVALLVVLAYLIAGVFGAEALARSIQAGTALAALPWCIPAAVAIAFLVTIHRGGPDPSGRPPAPPDAE